MSAENVEFVRRMLDLFNRRDLDTFTSWLHEDCEWVPALIREAEGTADMEFRGWAGFRRWIAATDAMMSVFQVEPESFHDVGDDRVLLLGVVVARGRASGAEVRTELGQVFTIRDGKLESYRGYLDRKEAMRAAGLTP